MSANSDFFARPEWMEVDIPSEKAAKGQVRNLEFGWKTDFDQFESNVTNNIILYLPLFNEIVDVGFSPTLDMFFLHFRNPDKSPPVDFKIISEEDYIRLRTDSIVIDFAELS